MAVPGPGLSKRRRILRAAWPPRPQGRLVPLGRWGQLQLQRAELPGRVEVAWVVRNFAAHVEKDAALQWVKETFWGFDETADDMQFLTQWKFLDLRGLGHLLGCPSLMEELKQHVASEGFGQMRWYGAQRQTTRHSDGFDGQSEVGPVVGKSRTLLRLGGDGFLTFHFEKAGGRCGRLDLLLHHGDLVVMDRQIAGTLPNGFQRSQRLWVTHRAGGLLAKRCPKHLKTSDARSFITLVWTSRQCPAEILTLLARHFPTLETLKQPTGETSGWPMDPKELGDVRWRKLLPWRPGLSLAERQVK